MTIPGSANPLLLRSASTAYTVSRSIRLNAPDGSYLSRTPASAGNRRTWTFSCWVKRSALVSGGAYNNSVIFSAGGSNPGFVLAFDKDSRDNAIQVNVFRGTNAGCLTNAVFRDLSAWMHICLAFDTTQATAANRVKLWVNGVEQTWASTNYPSQNTDYEVNNTSAHNIGRASQSSAEYFDGLFADIHFIDGQALTPSSFGEFDTNNVWQPKAYSGSYGTNGFHLDFSDNSNNTATTLGKDSAGSNNWTPNNLSVTAGAGNDSLVDSPTNYGTDTGAGGEVRGNYCTLNPAAPIKSTTTISNGALETIDTTAQGSGDGITVATMGVSTGKWYWEVTALDITGTTSNQRGNVGLLKNLGSNTLSTYLGANANSYSYYSGDGQKGNNNSFSAYGSTWATNDVIGVALNLDAGTLVFYKNNVSQGTAFSGLNTGETYFPACSLATNGKLAFNFGQRPFAYTAPSGFKALCTANLPEGTITTSGTFTGNANADGPFIWLNGVPTAMTINSNAVTFGTHADKLANGFKLRTNSTSYNTSGSNTYSVTTTGDKFKNARAQANP